MLLVDSFGKWYNRIVQPISLADQECMTEKTRKWYEEKTRAGVADRYFDGGCLRIVFPGRMAGVAEVDST